MTFNMLQVKKGQS